MNMGGMQHPLSQLLDIMRYTQREAARAAAKDHFNFDNEDDGISNQCDFEME